MDNFNWKEFFRLAIAVFLLGVGVSIIGNSSGQLIKLILGFGFVAIGVALIGSK